MSDEELARLARSAQAWEETAARHARDAEWLHGLLLKCAPLLGVEVYTDDTGEVKPDPFVSKIPEVLAKKVQSIAEIKLMLVELVEKNFVLEARLVGIEHEIAKRMGQEVREALLKETSPPQSIPDPTQTKKETS